MIMWNFDNGHNVMCISQGLYQDKLIFFNIMIEIFIAKWLIIQ